MTSLSHDTTPSRGNYKLDILPEDRLFTDARPDDLIIVSVVSILFHPIVLTSFKRNGPDRGGKEHCGLFSTS